MYHWFNSVNVLSHLNGESPLANICPCNHHLLTPRTQAVGTSEVPSLTVIPVRDSLKPVEIQGQLHRKRTLGFLRKLLSPVSCLLCTFWQPVERGRRRLAALERAHQHRFHRVWSAHFQHTPWLLGCWQKSAVNSSEEGRPPPEASRHSSARKNTSPHHSQSTKRQHKCRS